MAAAFKRDVFGNVEERRTEVEISKDGELLAVVYDTGSGWRTEYLGSAANGQNIPGLVEEIAEAQALLEDYINRCGLNAPVGLTPEGLSFWLMEKRDRTAMGQRIDA